MGTFRDKPAYLYVAVTLLGVYIVLTLVSASSLPLEVRQTESFSYRKTRRLGDSEHLLPVLEEQSLELSGVWCASGLAI